MLQAHYARVAALCFSIRTLFSEIIQAHQFHLVVVVSMPNLKSLCVGDLINSSPTQLSNFAPCSVAQASTAISVSILRVVSLAGGFGGAHDAGEGTHEHYADCRETSADDADIDFDVGPVDDVNLVPCWVSGGGETDERLEAEARYDCDTTIG